MSLCQKAHIEHFKLAYLSTNFFAKICQRSQPYTQNGYFTEFELIALVLYMSIRVLSVLDFDRTLTVLILKTKLLP